MRPTKKLWSGVLALAGIFGFAGAGHAFSIAGWTCQGVCGTLGADGVVTGSPFSGGDGSYGYVTTAGSNYENAGLPGVGGVGSPTNGSVLTSPLFAATAGQELSFFFNYVTSDGAGYADYAWARLLDGGGNQAALLFTARTTPGGDAVPGFAMPAPQATLVPPSTPIIPGAPVWGPLGGSSGFCFDEGCGYTGWIQALYAMVSTGSFRLQFGVTNWDDVAFQSGMAFDGATLDGVALPDVTRPPTGVPEPGPLALLGLALFGLRLMRARRD
jgi:hypothetical protein